MVELTLNVENLVTFTKGAQLLGVSRPTIYNLIAKYKLHPIAIGSNRYLLRDELEFLKEQYAHRKPRGSRS
jgi:excisionase family DNA binding protein